VHDSRRGFGFHIGFIDHFSIQLVITLNYSTTANLHNSQTTTAPAKSFPACSVFSSRSQATASNSGDSSASRAQVISERTSLPTRYTLQYVYTSTYEVIIQLRQLYQTSITTRLPAGHKRNRGSISAWGKYFSVHQVQIVSGVHPDFQPLYHHPNKLHRETCYKQKKNSVIKMQPRRNTPPIHKRSTFTEIHQFTTTILKHCVTSQHYIVSTFPAAPPYTYEDTGKKTKIFLPHYVQ
jgi:hypothetical protein